VELGKGKGGGGSVRGKRRIAKRDSKGYLSFGELRNLI